MIKILSFSFFISFPFLVHSQDISYDTLWKISPRVYIYGPTDIESNSRYTFETDRNIRFEFHFNYLFFKRKKVKHSSYLYYSRSIKQYQDEYQKKVQQGISIEKADSSILYRLTRHAVNYHRNHVFHSLGGYEKIETFDKLQGKYHYMDFYAAYRKKVPLYPLYRKNAWRRKKQDSIEVYDCSIERYLLVDSVIYLFTSSIIKPTRSRKRGLRIVEREFKQFVRCIWVKEDEEVLEK